MKVGIAGIGGIGSNAARHLAQAGLPHLIIVDFDRVEISNLNRQFYSINQAGKLKTLCLAQNLLGIFPDMMIETIDCRMEPGDALKVFFDCDIVVEGFDDKAAKKMLIEVLADSGSEKTGPGYVGGMFHPFPCPGGKSRCRWSGLYWGGSPIYYPDQGGCV